MNPIFQPKQGTNAAETDGAAGFPLEFGGAGKQGIGPMRLTAKPPAVLTRQSPASGAPARMVKVGVLVDLTWGPEAGGHVKCWERLAEAAARLPEAVDLTVHFSGSTPAVHPVADNVRYEILRSRFSTARLPFLSHVPDHTDLAPYHPSLARCLTKYDVIHTTDAYFAFARTALKVAACRGIPIINSIHTDTPSYTRLFTSLTVERLVGNQFGRRLLLDRLQIHAITERYARRYLLRHQSRCAFVLVSRAKDFMRARGVQPEGRIGFLRRGIDCYSFNPAKRDRVWLKQEFGIARDRVVIFFAGRLDRGKNVLTLGEAVKRLANAGAPVHLMCAGAGADREILHQRLGSHATCPGNLPLDILTRVYASADLFAQPSEIEVFGNVIMEAMASGLPVLVNGQSGMSGLVAEGETGVTIDGDGPEPWVAAIRALIAEPRRIIAMGRSARIHAKRHLPTWDDVLVQDLLLVWQYAAAARSRSPHART